MCTTLGINGAYDNTGSVSRYVPAIEVFQRVMPTTTVTSLYCPPTSHAGPCSNKKI